MVQLFCSQDKWYSFNDAEVKPFDPNHIASECFGGEMSSRTYDQVQLPIGGIQIISIFQKQCN